MILALLTRLVRSDARPRVAVNQSMGQFVDQGGELRFVVVARAKAQGVGLAHALEDDSVERRLREAEASSGRELLNDVVTVRFP